MSYLYNGIAKTQKGKVIYRRKKHESTWKDVWRFVKKLPAPNTWEMMAVLLGVAVDLALNFRDVEKSEVRDIAFEFGHACKKYKAELESFEGFGGGEFGGGGASGTFHFPWQGNPLKP